MTGYYELIDKLKTVIQSDNIINTVTKGSIDQIDSFKTTMYPLCHVMINNIRLEGAVNIYNISFILMDIVETNKNEHTDPYFTKDNEDDVLHQMLKVATRLYEDFRRGVFRDDHQFHLVDESGQIELFVDRFIDRVAGATLTLDVSFYNDGSIC